MEHRIVTHAQPQAWLNKGVLAKQVARYQAFLKECRYGPRTRHNYLCCVAHLAHWMASAGLSASQIGEGVINRFLGEHLPRCECPRPVRRLHKVNRAALRLLLKALRVGGQIEPCEASDHIGRELRRFDLFMTEVRGLALSTRQLRLGLIRSFLRHQFGSKPIRIRQVNPSDLRRFLFARHQALSAAGLKSIAEALRGYIQFRVTLGDPVQRLALAIPAVAHRRLSTLPRILSEADIRRLLRSFDQSTAYGKRDYAMARCFIDLGLRAHDVVRLRLEDIDWRNATIRLVGNKSRRTDILPLPEETGRAIAAYLKTERPATTNRAVFVRHVAPYDEPIGRDAVRRVMIAAFRRCGWSHCRVHILRHSTASRLLAAGTPLKEIADILRHRSLDTTAIYTKVDTNRLAAVALPWPGRAA
jgi:site-specific recombinase XerD